MLGFADVKKVAIWLQTEKESTVDIEYYEKGNSIRKKKTASIITQKNQNFTHNFILNGLKSNKIYVYEIRVNGIKLTCPYPLEFRTQAKSKKGKNPPDFSFAFGSCNYIFDESSDSKGKENLGKLEIFNTIESLKPSFMIWGGDNFYYRDKDYSQDGMWYRNDQTRQVKILANLLGKIPQYAIWDDHDYGPNDSDRDFELKHISLEVFKQYWANPNFIFENEGITGKFSWADIDFFLMDNRWNKAPNKLNDPNKAYFGEKQLLWLIKELSKSKASFKVIVSGGQILNPAKIFENMANYEGERKKLLNEIEARKISGVVFLTGDRHSQSFWKLNRVGTYPLYEVTASPLTASVAPANELDNNEVLVEQTLVNKNGFAYLQVSGTKKERILKIQMRGTAGEVFWEQILQANNLK